MRTLDEGIVRFFGSCSSGGVYGRKVADERRIVENPIDARLVETEQQEGRHQNHEDASPGQGRSGKAHECHDEEALQMPPIRRRDSAGKGFRFLSQRAANGDVNRGLKSACGCGRQDL
jgi:hypothetical protein